MRSTAVVLLAVTALLVPAATTRAAPPHLQQVLGPDPPLPPEQTNGAEPERPSQEVQFGGWARTSVEATPPTGDATGHANQPNAPHDEIVARQLLNVRTRYSRGRSVEAVGGVLLAYDFFKPESRPGERTAPSRTDLRAEVREAYLGYFTTALDVRAGVQRIAWGHADTFSPNDVVDANDIRDPILSETELLHRPMFSARVDLERHWGSLQIVAQPFFQPDRYDVYGSNWALVQSDAPAGYRGAIAVLSRQAGTAPKDAAQAILGEPPRPEGFAGSQGGLRVDWKAATVDVTHYYHYGYHGTPDFRIDRGTVALLDSVDWTSASPDQARALLSGIGAGDAIGSRWVRRHHFGTDLGTTKGPFVLRADTAYEQPALFYDRTLNGWLSPAVQAVVGAEFQTGDLGRTILVEARYRHIQRQPPAGGLLFAERNSLDTAALVRWTWGNRIELETRGLAGLSPASYVFRPQIALKHDRFALRLGGLLLDGEEGSFGRWYRRNRGLYVMLRAAF